MPVITSETRPWGAFEVLVDDPYTKVKRLTVNPKQRLSLQTHTKRQEHWVVVKGIATVTINDTVSELKYGQEVFIPQGAKHRLANMSEEAIEVIEVQTGSYFGEDDIERHHDDYARTE